MRRPQLNLAALLASAGVWAWSAVADAWRWLMADQANSYHPEAHYMRGPGPKWREKNAQMSTRR
jgi:hypothetical protein